jgi:voltage-gated potassium channel
MRLTREQLDRVTPFPMFVASVALLLLVAGELHFNRPALFRPLLVACHYGLAITWPLFLVDAIAQLVAGNPRWKNHFAICLCPPLRLAARDAKTGTRIWLPRLGWVPVDDRLRQRVEQSLNLPMLGISLLVIPVLALDYYQPDHHPIVTHVQSALQMSAPQETPTETSLPWLANVARVMPVRVATRIGEALIWTAFALEFVIMISIVERKLKYCVQHWIDLLVIVLPLVGFLRTLRLARLARLNQLGRFTRLYRLRGSVLRAQRGMVVASLLERVIHRNPEKRLVRLKTTLAEKELEVASLRSRIDDLHAEISEAARLNKDAA